MTLRCGQLPKLFKLNYALREISENHCKRPEIEMQFNRKEAAKCTLQKSRGSKNGDQNPKENIYNNVLVYSRCTLYF